MKKFYTLFTALFFALFSFMTYAQGPWNFNGSNDIWESTGTSANLTSGASFSTLDVNSAGNPMLRTFSANINASAVTHAVITLKNNTANKYMRVFYQTTGTNRYVNVGITANDADFVSYYVDMTGNADWTGTVNELTIQFKENSSYSTALDGTIDIDNIEMTSSDLGVNMVNNSSFENWVDDTEATPVDPVGFYKHESVERSSDSHSGDYSLKVIATSTLDLAQTVNEITAGATYRVSINYKIEANTGNGVRLWSTWKDASNVSLASSDLQPSGFLNTVSSEWATFSVDAVAPENATKLNFEVRSYNGATVYWDSFSVSKVAEPVQPLLITTSVCSTATSVRLTGPWWGWDPAGGPEAANNGDGTWTFTFDPAPTDNMEYLLVVNGVQENLISIMANGGDCAPVTDNANYANRRWDLGTGDVTNTYGQCGSTCVAPVITLTGTDVTINNGDTYTDAGATASDDEEGDITANIVLGGDTVDTNTDGTYTITYDVSDGAGNAATTVSRVVTVETPVQPLLITTSVCSTATSVRLTGPWWGWDPAGGPEAANNGDGTWTFTFDPAPTDNMEYLLVVDGVQENLISIMANGGTCAPVTDNASYANRLWVVDSGDVTNNYGQCGTTCVAPVITLTGGDETITVGDTYTDAGATASDDEQGDISSDILTTSDVDTSVAGVYTVAYNVSDGALNAATEVTRTVTVEAALPPNESDSEQFCANGTDAAPTSITLTPDDLTVNNGANLLSVSVTSGTIGNPAYVGNWYDANLTVTGGVSDGITATGLAQMSDLDITGFTSITMTSVDLDAYADTVEMCLNLLVTWELPTVNDDEVVCANGTDAAPTTITLTPNDLTVNGGQQITAISVTSGTIGNPAYVGNWYDANLTVTGGVSDGITATGLAQMSDLDITGFTSITMTSVDLDAYADTVEMCLNLSVTYLEPSCLNPTDLAVSDVTTTTASVTWTANNGETAWEYQVVESGATPAETGTATSDNPLALTGLTANTAYDVYVRANCGDGVTSAWVMVSFTTPLTTQTSFPYCSSFDTDLGDWSTEVTQGTSNWESASSSNNSVAAYSGGGSAYYYSGNYNGDSSVLISRPMDITALASPQVTFQIANPSWGADQDVLEVWYKATAADAWSVLGTYSDATTTFSEVTLNLPNASNDYYIAFNATSGYGYGVLIDDVCIAEAPSCIDPTDLTVADITQTTASVTWTANNGESAWEYQVVESGVAPDATGTATSDNPLALTGLTENTLYDVYVRANCDADGTSEWVTVSFTTLPAPIVPDYTNDFTTFPGDLWSEAVGAIADGPSGTTSLWDTGNFAHGTNAPAAYINIYSTNIDEWLISPSFDLSGVSYYLNVDVAATEYLSSFSTADPVDAIWGVDDFVTLMVSEDSGSTWTELYRWDANNNPGVAGAAMPEIDLSAYTGLAKFAFYAESTASNEDIDFFVDNFSISSTSLGLEDVNTSSNFTYFPNPVNNVLSIKAQASIDSITVYNMLGQTVVRSTPNTTTTAVDMSGLQTGAYFVQVAINNSIETVRVIKN